MEGVQLPIIITNFKTYESATGQAAVSLAKIHEEVARKYGVHIAVCPQVADLERVSRQVQIPVLAQHIDCISYGQNTGFILPEAVKAAGAIGSLLNHAERRIPFSLIADSINRAKELGFFALVCAKDVQEAEQLAALNPDALAIEPPELIGGDISISTASPDIIINAVKKNPHLPIIVGAGVKTGDDVKRALELGAAGVLVASGVTRSPDPRKVLEDFARAMVR